MPIDPVTLRAICERAGSETGMAFPSPESAWVKRLVELLEDHSVMKERPDCNTCANRGAIDGMSQETHCEHCQWQEKWRANHYVMNSEITGLRDSACPG